MLSTVFCMALALFSPADVAATRSAPAFAETVTAEADKTARTAAQYDSPQAAVKAFIPAWRRKNRPAMLKIAEKEVVDNIGNLIKGSTFQGCTENTESAQKAYNCKIQAGDDDLTAVYLEVVLTRIGYRIMAVDFAAAH